MNTIPLSEQEVRLYAMTRAWFIACDPRVVNLDDLLNINNQPGAVVRCSGDPRAALMVVCTDNDDAQGCVAGWISDEA